MKSRYFDVLNSSKIFQIDIFITGLCHDTQTLEPFFLTSPDLNNIYEDFSKYFGLKSSRSREEHHHLIGSSNENLSKNIEKLDKVLKSYSVTFSDDSDTA